MAQGSTSSCPLCCADRCDRFQSVGDRDYWRCGRCLLTFLDRSQLPSPAQERAHYATHQNDVDDPGYRAFLGRLADPLVTRLAPNSRGLDYGCGPGPALITMLEEAGHMMHGYDPFYRADPRVLAAGPYDFVTCTETAEHFHHPGKEFSRLATLVYDGGLLAVMTSFQTDDTRFAHWHYRADPTHVAFYREETFRVLATDLGGWRVEVPRKDVVLMRRPVV